MSEAMLCVRNGEVRAMVIIEDDEIFRETMAEWTADPATEAILKVAVETARAAFLQPAAGLISSLFPHHAPQSTEEGTKSCIGEFRRGIETAAASHDQVVTDLRNDQKSYKNGKILRSAQRASDFHERSAAAIRRLAEVQK